MVRISASADCLEKGPGKKVEKHETNIARGTTDPWADSITGGTNIASKFSQQVAPHEFVGNSCISRKFGHQVAPLALAGNLVTRWRYLH